MYRQTSRLRFGAVVIALATACIASACAESANPARPSPVSGTAAATDPISVKPESAGSSAGGVLTPTDLTNRGWSCFQPPVVPVRIVCSHPNQGFPVVGNPPPADRPASYQFLIFDGTGRFTGPEFLIRSDLYRGQLCEMTGEPYVFVPIIGYYECVHPGGR